MKKIITISLLLLFCSCSMQEDIVHCKDLTEFGVLYKNGMKFHCPFKLQKKSVDYGFVDVDYGITVLDSNVGEYFPLKLWNAPYMYRIKMSGLKKHFTEEQYIVNLWTTDENYRSCGESREFTFYKVAESSDSIEYASRRVTEVAEGRYVFFGQREMPSDDWYHVLKVCDDGRGFLLSGEIKQ